MDATVVILTALNLEYDAVRAHLTDLRNHVLSSGTRFEVGKVAGTKCRIALGLTGKGNQPAGVLAERAIHEFSPAATLFVGVAGALWDGIPLGDVVVATHVYAYHGGTSEDDALSARPRVWEVEHGLSQLAMQVARSDTWARRLGIDSQRPDIRFGTIAAGEIVQNSRVSNEARWLRAHYNDALAIEMESAGVVQAGHLNNSVVGVVRGISDMANGTKNGNTDADCQPHAAANAAAFAVQLAEELITERRSSAMSADGSPHMNVINTSHGQVGIQAATVTGSTVYMTGANTDRPSIADLISGLDELRSALALTHSSGDIDTDTFNASQNELNIADSALTEEPPDCSGRFTLAMKRLRGLVIDVADLAAKAATLIAVAKELS